jgi:molecular chaperone GrpE
MSEQTQPDLQPDTASNDAGTETITIPAAEFETAKRDASEWKDRSLRNQAEFENIRKRLRKEADEAGVRGVVRAMKPLLNEIDNLGRAIDSATPETFAEFAQGVTMIRENLKNALIGQGIEAIPCEGIFDPTVHEVIAEQEAADVPKGTILQVFRAGYKLKDQLIRTAQVVVAKPSA